MKKIEFKSKDGLLISADHLTYTIEKSVIEFLQKNRYFKVDNMNILIK